MVEPEPESPVVAERPNRGRRGSRSGSISSLTIAETDADCPTSGPGVKASNKTSSGRTSPSIPIPPKEISQRSQKQSGKIKSKLEAIKQDPELEKKFEGWDNVVGCCCTEDDEMQEQISTPPAESSRRSSLGKMPWTGNTGYHRRIWKRERGVGGRGTTDYTASSGESSSNIATASGTSTPNEPSQVIISRTQSSDIDESSKIGSKDKGKGKAKEGLWSKMKGKASVAVSSKDKGKATASSPTLKPSDSTQIPKPPTINTTKDESHAGSDAPSGCDIVSPSSTTSPTATSIEILRWETQLLHQQHADRSCTNNNSEDTNDALDIPWPYKEFAMTTRDGRSSYRGFCSWCGGSLTYRTSVTLNGLIDIHAGSMDDPETALRKIGFLREFHCDMAGDVEIGARLGTTVGHERDGRVLALHGCDIDDRPYLNVEDEDFGKEDFEDGLDGI
ncbi:hypothetical protein AA313_de0202118 [Arthrobotrys entomopaga]|nr:hypothetical protein AA313_de0202118 [Arthrobotrys entomopaga]